MDEWKTGKKKINGVSELENYFKLTNLETFSQSFVFQKSNYILTNTMFHFFVNPISMFLKNVKLI